jgi:starch synthase
VLGLSRNLFHVDRLEFYGAISYLKGGLVYADRITTVSRKYAEEIQTPEYGFGLDGVVRARSEALSGIVNGVDYAQWDPATDKFLAKNFSPEKLEGKRECKRELLEKFGLPVELDRPLIGIVSRFAAQKGFDLIAQVAHELAAQDLAVVALGTGEPEFESLFERLAFHFPQRIGVKVAYDNALAHKIEGGADMFLMPSRYEPCGLNQIYSLKYGTVPVVRATGGLDDTIDSETGFKFYNYDGRDLLETVHSALKAYRDKKAWKKMMLAGMGRDFSWTNSARQYADLYAAMRA